MATSTLVKALALLLFIAGIAGATYAVTNVLGDTVQSSLVNVAAPRATQNATGGHDVTYLVTVTNRDTVARDIVLETVEPFAGRSDPTTVLGGSNATVFLTVHVPEGATPGEHDLDVRILAGETLLRERDGLLTLRVMGDAPGFGDGDSAQILYTGRLTATGRVFNANDRGIVGLNLPKTDTYRFSDGVLDVATRPRLNIVSGLGEGMLGMQPGESRTITFPPEKGYGPATQDQTFPRDETLARDLTVPNEAQAVARDTFDAYITETRQGDASNFTAGQTFLLDQDGNVWPYRVTNITSDVVRYKLAAQPGDAFTIYPFWTNASVVQSISDEEITFFTTPSTQPGDTFTFKNHWPEMSALKEFNETHIVVRNSPPVGFSFTQVVGNAPRESTVREVTETTIIAVLPSQNPLAGKELTFDVTMLSLTKGN